MLALRLSLRAPAAAQQRRSIHWHASPTRSRPALPFRHPAGQEQRRGSTVAVRAMSTDFAAMIKEKNAANAVMVYSKTYCPYCTQVKGLFTKLGVEAKVVELDGLADGSSVHEALQALTGRRTVPQVFIGGQHVGGCDDTLAAYSSGQLKQLLTKAGVNANL